MGRLRGGRRLWKKLDREVGTKWKGWGGGRHSFTTENVKCAREQTSLLGRQQMVLGQHYVHTSHACAPEAGQKLPQRPTVLSLGTVDGLQVPASLHLGWGM